MNVKPTRRTVVDGGQSVDLVFFHKMRLTFPATRHLATRRRRRPYPSAAGAQPIPSRVRDPRAVRGSHLGRQRLGHSRRRYRAQAIVQRTAASPAAPHLGIH